MKITIGADLAVMDLWEQFDSCQTKSLFSDVVDAFKSSDRVILNLECAVTDKNTPIKKIGPNLKAPLNTVKVLKEAGVTDLSLANNHIFDFGKAGVIDTLNLLEKYGINYTGLGKNEIDSRKNLIIANENTKVCVISVCEHEYSYALENRMGARAYDPYDTNDDIQNAKKENDFVIVLYHGGKEDCPYPSPRLLKACRSMVNHGADLVLCQHSHCIGCYEEYNGGHILYGQGNFHFACKNYEDASDNGEKWNTGLLVNANFDNKITIELLPTIVSDKGVRLAKEAEKQKILSSLFERSKRLKDNTWRKEWEKFALSQKRYKIIPNELREEIAHYFDCEAHTDVCKEIFKTYNATNEQEN